MSKVQHSVDAATTVVNATASAAQGVGEGAKSVGKAVLDTASSVANSPTVGKVGGFLGDKFMQYWQAAEDLTKEYVPKALDALLWVIRVDAITTLVYAWALIIAFYVGYRIIRRVWNHLAAAQAAAESYSEKESAKGTKFMSAIILSAALFFGVIITSPTWTKAFDVWTYVTVAKPELYLAKLAVDGGTAKIKEYTGSKSVK